MCTVCVLVALGTGYNHVEGNRFIGASSIGFVPRLLQLLDRCMGIDESVGGGGAAEGTGLVEHLQRARGVGGVAAVDEEARAPVLPRVKRLLAAAQLGRLLHTATARRSSVTSHKNAAR
jgi:hypothetical protein